MSTTPTRQHLVEVGLKAIHANGYNATGVKEVLDLAGVPKGSFYHYFPSKEAFAKEVFQLYADGEYSRCQRFFSQTELPPLIRLRRYFDELVATFGQTGPTPGCLLGNMSLEVSAQSPDLQLILSNSFQAWQEAIASMLREAIDRGDLPQSTQPDLLAGFLVNNWEGALVRSKAEKNNQPLEQFLHFTFTQLLHH